MSEIDLPFDLRIESAGRYYSFLEKVRDLSWIEVLHEINSNTSYGIPEVLVLLEPKYYEQLRAIDPRGERAFAPAIAGVKCRSKEVWGYECPFTDSSIHVDHMFPRSKGGSTDHHNAMYLCPEHNMSKHTDIHLILWETIPNHPGWIVRSMERLLNHALRLTKENLYLPSSQLSKI